MKCGLHSWLIFASHHAFNLPESLVLWCNKNAYIRQRRIFANINIYQTIIRIIKNLSTKQVKASLFPWVKHITVKENPGILFFKFKFNLRRENLEVSTSATIYVGVVRLHGKTIFLIPKRKAKSQGWSSEFLSLFVEGSCGELLTMYYLRKIT